MCYVRVQQRKRHVLLISDEVCNSKFKQLKATFMKEEYNTVWSDSWYSNFVESWMQCTMHVLVRNNRPFATCSHVRGGRNKKEQVHIRH
jgi:hypothetical protein